MTAPIPTGSPKPTGSKSKPPEPAAPRIRVVNRQRKVPVDRRRLEELANACGPGCLAHPGSGETPLPQLAEVEVILVSDRVSAQVHLDFSGVAGATDVITFQHGELVISPATAERAGHAHSEPFLRELLRYVVHGLLHLNGHLDGTPPTRRRMWKAQESVIDSIWPLTNATEKSQHR